jgi:hypothetical protein
VASDRASEQEGKLDLVVAINAAHYGSPLQGLIPIAILNRSVLPAVNDYLACSE